MGAAELPRYRDPLSGELALRGTGARQSSQCLIALRVEHLRDAPISFSFHWLTKSIVGVIAKPGLVELPLPKLIRIYPFTDPASKPRTK